MERLSKNIGLPDLAGITLIFLKEIVNHILALLLSPYDGRDLCFNICSDHMNGGGAGFQTYPVSSSLLDDFRLFQYHFLWVWHYDSIPGSFHLLKSGRYLIVPGFHGGQLGHKRHQIPIVCNLHSALLGQCAVK